MTEFGDQLRLERERRGMTLEQIFAETKVNPRHFEALERGDYKALPGGVFRKGIVRAYLNTLGLDEDSWMLRFQSSYAEHARDFGEDPDADSADWSIFAENVRRNRNPKRKPNTRRWLGVLLLFVLLAAAAWAVWHFVLQAKLATN